MSHVTSSNEYIIGCRRDVSEAHAIVTSYIRMMSHVTGSNVGEAVEEMWLRPTRVHQNSGEVHVVCVSASTRHSATIDRHSYASAREPYMHANEPYIFATQPNMCVLSIPPTFIDTRMFPPKSSTSTQTALPLCNIHL